MIKGIIFDMDGTIIDTNDLVVECIRSSVEEYLKFTPKEEDIINILGKPLKIQMGFFSGEYIDDMVSYYSKLYRLNRDEKTMIFDGVISLLNELNKKNIKMAIVSNKGNKGIQHALKKFNIEKYFDIVISVNDVENKKPHPEGVRKVLKSWGFSPGEVIFIGDSNNDILCANNAKIKAVLVAWSIIPMSHFRKVNIDYIINEAKEILTIIER